MGLDSLQYLELAGVRWELSDAANQNEECKVQSVEYKLSNAGQSPANLDERPSADALYSTPSTLHSSIIPSSAPVEASTAEKMAKSASNFDELAGIIDNFNHPLKQFAKSTVKPHPGTGSDILIITDMPSGDDDESGRILTGAAGDLLNKMLGAINVSRDSVSIAPLVFWRTPGGRAPSREELDLSRPFLDRMLSLLSPKYIITLGTLTAMEMAGAKLPKQHGQISECNSIPVIPIYHPNYLLLKPDAKRDVWAALQNLRNMLKTA